MGENKGHENVIKANERRTTEEQRKIARMGGIASGKTRRMQATMKMIMSLPYKSDGSEEAEELVKFAEENGVELTIESAICLAQALKAIKKQNTKAADFARDTSGQKPTDRIEVATIDREQSLEMLDEIFNDAEQNARKD